MRRLVICILLAALTIAQGAAQNMLNNPGFETGLMCYWNYVWDGYYVFQQSTDAHSGQYSFEMSCSPTTGGNCYKAAQLSDSIPAPPNQSYKMSIYSKCPTGTYAIVYIPGMVNGDVSAQMNCTGDWSPNTFTFQNGPAETNMFYYIFLFGPSWLEVDDVVLTYGDGTAPQHVVQHPGTRNVSISGQKVLVDGKPFLSLGFYSVGYNDLAQAAATGATMINGGGTYNAADCFNYGQPSYLDQVYNLGMTFMPESSTTARLQTPAMATAAQVFAPHLANVAWYLADEPDLQGVYWEYVPPGPYMTDYQNVKSQTTLPELTDFQSAAYGSYSDVAPYNGTADIWMAEPYGPDFSSVNHAIDLFNSVQSRPIWLAQDDVGAALLVPKAYWAIIAGATGISYFNWDTFKANPADLAAATQAFTELKGLKNAIFGTPVDSLVTPPAGIASMSRFDPATGSTYILSANSVANNVSGSFAVQGLLAGQTVNVMYENRTIAAGAGSFSDTFTGVSRHAYSFTIPPATLNATIGTASGQPASRDWKIRVYDTGTGAANGAQITGMTVTQTGGAACTPTIAPGTFPLALGTIAPSQSTTADVSINFTGCPLTSKFTASITLAANGGETSATIVRPDQHM
jgi:hypothetical protein